MKERLWAVLFCAAVISAAVAMTACESGGSDDDSGTPATTNDDVVAVVRDVWEGDLDVDMYTSKSTPILVSPGNGFLHAQVLSAASDAPVSGIIVSTSSGMPSATGNGWNFTMQGSATLNSTWVISVENPNRRSLMVHVKVWYSSE